MAWMSVPHARDLRGVAAPAKPVADLRTNGTAPIKA